MHRTVMPFVVVFLASACDPAETTESSTTTEPTTTTTPSTAIDQDGDGVDASLDCDDTDALRYPGAIEVCDGIDNDCNDVVDDDPSDGLTY